MPNHMYEVVTTGKDPLTRPILDYLDRTYGIPATDIRSLDLHSQAGGVQTVTVTLMVRKGSPGPDAADTAIIRPVNPNAMPREWPDA
jgi:hypothetical protein